MKEITPLAPNANGTDVANLQKALQLFLEKGAFTALQPPGSPSAPDLARLAEALTSEVAGATYGKATTELVRIFQVQQRLGDNLKGVVEDSTARKMNEWLKKFGVLDTPGDRPYTVSGTVVNTNGVTLGGYVVEAFIVTLAKDIPAGKGISEINGTYAITYRNPLTDLPDIAVRVYRTDAPDAVFRSVVKYNATPDEKIDVYVNAAEEKEAPEFNKIINDLQPHLGGLKLGNLKEDKQAGQITYLANKTGWDGRITAMLAGAHQLGSALKIDPSHIYAFLRAGIPADADSIKSVSVESAKAVIANAVQKNIITDNGQTDQTLNTLASLSVDHILNSKPFASVSSLSDLLGLRLNTEQRNIFAQTQKQAGDDPGKLWPQLAQRGFSAATISQLKLDGKLAFLTGRNAPLVKRISEKFNLKEEVDLVRNGLYKSSAWKDLIGTDIPGGITADEYAGHLAGLVKSSYPTAVTAEMIRQDEVKIEGGGSKEELTNFLYSNEAKNNIGMKPVKTWDGFGQLSSEAKGSAKMIERIYQLTPSDESMAALSKTGLHAAYQITRFSQNEFVEKFGAGFPDTQEALSTYKKAHEIYSASLGIATTYLTSRTMPNVYALTGKQAKEQDATIAYPTLEELLGNMDYCSCEECKSVLSPAAYLVELLQFLDREDAVPNPIAALKARRPDIEHIQLSCENTNLALPYIDLVNEILEHYMIHGDLTDLKGHDIGENMTQAELLAEPQFVNQAAYEELKTKVFPYNLPFHQPLETLRDLFKMWDVTLGKMLAVFSGPLPSRKEILGFNEDEYKSLTDITFRKLPEYFGEPGDNTISRLNDAIADGKTFSRRVGIGYDDLAALLQTRFINPGITRVPLFQKLKISLEDLDKFYTGALTDAQLDALIPAGTDPADYGNDIKQWLRDNRRLIMGLITLTAVTPGAVECNFAEVQLRLALPDNANNKLDEISYHKLHRFLRLLRKTGWSMQTLDSMVTVLLTLPSDQITVANIDEVFIRLLDRVANFREIAGHLSYSEKKFPDLLLMLDPSVSDSLRREQCAIILRQSPADMAELIAITGIDPLADDMEADEPSLMKFIHITQQLKAASLKVADLAYILHHHDRTGKLTPSDTSLLKNIKILRDALNAVEKENSIAPDNADFNFARNKMLLVYDAAATDDFFELLLHTKIFRAPLAATEEVLPDKLLQAADGLGFEAFKKEIVFAGLLSGSVKAALEQAADSLTLADMVTIDTQPLLDTFKNDFKNAVGAIFSNSNAALASFAANFPELKVIYDAVIAEMTPEGQTQKLVELVLPTLKSALKTNALQQALTGILKADSEVVAVLTGNKDVLESAADAAETVLYDFTQLEEKIVFDQNKTYSFYVDVPATDDFLIYVSAPRDTVISLGIDDTLIIDNVTVDEDGEIKNAIPLFLKTGTLHAGKLTIAGLPAAEKAVISWRTKGMAKAAIPGAVMYADERVNSAKTSLIRLFKATQLQNIFGFTARELEYFAAENEETKGCLSDLDADGSISEADLVNLWNRIELLVSFNLIKQENEPEENTWLQMLKDPAAKNAQDKFMLEYFNLWQEADLAAVLAHFAFTRADLSRLSVLKKVRTAMELLRPVHYPSSDVLTWITNDPSYNLVAAIKAAVKEKVTEASWLETMQTVSDPVRNLLRDALVAYILQYKKPSPEIISPDKLYEYFLIDVEMDACMKTSRIRMALSTVQLFIQRCLMNLEPSVAPASISAEQWAWMKRYRVWEANRKVFLYPENWLEPELRDNKSPIFEELEGELLQAEVTDESAELAFLNYLKKLDDIAKLELVGTYLEENQKGNQFDDVLHVIGRTNGKTRQYYYRRYEYGYWTAWEKVGLTVEGDHVFPMVWKKRLFLFWLNTFEKPVDVNKDLTPTAISTKRWDTQKRLNVEINICWGEYYKGKWTSPKSTELTRPMVITGLTSFDSTQLQIYGRTDPVENPPGKFRERLILYLQYNGNGGDHKEGVFTFTSKNAPPYLEYGSDALLRNNVADNLVSTFTIPASTGFLYGWDLGVLELPFYYMVMKFNSQLQLGGRDFKVNIPQPGNSGTNSMVEEVLTKSQKLTSGYTLLPTYHPVENQFEAPLAYADEHSTFFLQAYEKVSRSIRDFEGYYPLGELPVKYEDIPVLVERPVAGWPPEDLVNIPDDVVINNPWRWGDKGAQLNVNYQKVLPTDDIFTFGDTQFDAGGKNLKSVHKNF